MIKPDQIPDEVVEAYLLARSEGEFTPNELIAAALNAWPNRNIVDDDVVYVDRAIMLPLPQEGKNDQA